MKTFKQLLEGVIQPNGTDKIKTEDLKGACWKGYEAIGMKKKNGKMVPNCVPVKEEALDESKMSQIHADIEDHLGKHVANYKKMGGSEHLGNKTVEVAKKLAKTHGIATVHAQKFVNDYVNNALKESDASWAASLEKKKEDKLTSKDKGTLGKIHDLMAKEKAKKEFDLKMKKAQNSQRVAKALGEEIINEAHVVHVSDGSKYDEEPHEQDVKHVNDGVKKHGGKFDGHSDKGAFFKFGSHADAENFRRHVNASPKKTVHADHLDESVNEAVDKEHPIYKEYQSLKKQPLKDLKDQIKRQHRVIDTSEFRTKEHAASHILHNKHGAHRMKAVFGEETELDEAYRLPSDSEIDKVKAHVKANHPNKSLAQVAVHKQTKKIEYVVKDKEGKMSGHILGEEVEQIDEVSGVMVDRALNKAGSNLTKAMKSKDYAAGVKSQKQIHKFLNYGEKKGTIRNLEKHGANEEVEHIDEISKDTLHSYIHKAFAQGNDLHYDLAHSRGDKATDAERKALQAKISKRNTGIMKAGKKLREDVSMLSFDDYLKEQKACKKEELHPNQKKLDKNNNGKLDSDDFVKLRAGKKEVDEKYVSDAQRKAVWASKNEKGVKEEAELDEKYDHGPIDREATVKIGHHAAVVAGSGVDSGKHGKVIGQSKTHIGDQWHIKTADGEVVKMYKNRVAKLKEQVELDEAMTPMQKLKDALDRHSEKAVAANKAGDHEAVKVHQGYMNKIKTKMGKLAKNEEVDLQEMEELCEISKSTLKSYVKKAVTDVGFRGIDAGKNSNSMDRLKAYDKMGKRVKGVEKATNKLAKEEVEQIDEISKQTLASYIPKAAQSARFSGMTAQDMQNRSDRARNKGMKDSFHRLSMKYKNKAWDREDNIKKAAQKLVKESYSSFHDENDKHMLHGHEHNHMSIDPYNHRDIKDSEDRHWRNKHDKAEHHLSSARDAHESGNKKAYHTHMAKYHDIQADYHDHPAGDDDARESHDHAMNSHKKAAKSIKEEVEQIDELSKKTLQSYQSKIGRDLDRAMDAMPHGTGNDKEDRKLNNRMVGDERAQKRLMKKEETDVLTFKELMQNISEAAIDDLKDRIAARKATQSAYDKDYKPSAKSNVQKVKGHSYGAGEEEGEDDEDTNTKKVSKPAEPAVKRGRGRPAGSKSGARR